MTVLFQTLRNLLRRHRLEGELDEELRFHLEKQIEVNLGSGMPPDEARRRALIELGGPEQVKERVREARSGFLLEAFWKDLRHGARMLGRNPGFTAVAVLTLALGIGANTAIFSLVDGILLRPLPYPQPGRLAVLLQSQPSAGLQRWGLSQFLFASFRDQARSFQGLAAYTTDGLNLTGLDEPVRVQTAHVTAGFSDVLGVRPALGRAFLPEEDAPGRNDVCILSDRLWRGRLGGDPGILSRSVRLNDSLLHVVGVMPPGFRFPGLETDVWVPLGLDPERRFGFTLTGIARLKDGVTAAAAESEATGLQWDLARQSENPPPTGSDLKMIVTPLQEALTRTVRQPLIVLLGAVGLVLLIACANIANLLLARITARRHEMALRISLGASPRRLAAQLLTESLLLSVLGAAAGVLVALWVVALLGRLPLEGVPRVAEVHVNAGALAFTAATALLTGVLCGWLPAVRAYRIGQNTQLREGTRNTASASSRGAIHVLVGAQVALSIVLLIGAGLLLKSFAHLLAVNQGFQSENLLTMRLSPSGERYGSPEKLAQFYETLIDRVRRLPDVRAAGLISNLPIQSDGWSDAYVVEGHERPGSALPNALIRVGFPGYFQAVGVPVRGRDFSGDDDGDAVPVAIVDETLARLYWPDGNALGKRIRLGWDTSERAWMTIVGVAGSVKHAGLAEPWYPHLYLPFRQSQDTATQMHLAVRTVASPSSATASIRAQVRDLDAHLPVFAVRTMPDLVDETLNSQRMTNLLLTAFAATALLLAVMGIYGVMSINVTGRMQEFGVRMALGAQRGDVFGLVLRQGMRIALLGAGVGLLCALGVTQVLRTLLFEVSPFDPVTFLGVAGVLGAAALAACWLPARRATRADPIRTLRCE
ncbi:MAG: ADOP family duplicated permease [Candidatus Polarisedimenticolia bacterium]